MTTPAEVLSMLKEKEVKFVDLRFTDTRGKEQHVTVPSHTHRHGLFRRRQDVRRLVDRRLEGHQRVRHGADAGCHHGGARSVLRRDHADPALRRARAVDDAGLRARSALAREARRGLPEVHRHRRPRAVRSGERILHFRQRALRHDHAGLVLRDRVDRGGVELGQALRGRQQGAPSGREGRLLPGAAGRFVPGPALGHVPGARRAGHEGRSASPRSRHRRPVRDRRQRQYAGAQGRRSADAEVRDAQRRARLRQDRHLHAEADRRRQRQRHARAPVDLEGRQAAVRGRQVRGPVGHGAVLHRRHHQAREGDQRVHERRAPTATSDWCRASKRR